jgi:hypothetical protein
MSAGKAQARAVFSFGVAFVSLIVCHPCVAPGETLTVAGTAYTQNFDGGAPGNLAATGTTSTSVPGTWRFSESLGGATTTYRIGTGSINTGDTYSFGATNSTERAFGGLQSGTLNPTIGVSFTNQIGVTITDLAIDYVGEQWRIGALAREDRLNFQYSLNATSLTTGTWTDFDTLDFVSPTQTGAIGSLDGNDAVHQTKKADTITGLSILHGSTFWLRWTDFNAAGADDGLAIDDFSLTANPVAVAVVPIPPAALGGLVLLPLAIFKSIRARRDHG